MEQEFVIEFAPADNETASLVKETFKDEEVLQANAFGGAMIISIIAASTTVIKLAFQFYKEYRASLRNAKIKISGKEVSFEGFSADEINNMIKEGTIRKVQDKLL